MRITRREKKFWEQHLSCVRHITLDPKLSLIHISMCIRDRSAWSLFERLYAEEETE